VDNASDIVVTTDMDLRITSINPAIERILGCSIELVVGERSAIQEAWRYTPSGAA